MKDTELYSQILGISSPWYVTNIELKLQEDAVYVHLSYQEKHKKWPCPECAIACSVYDHNERRVWRHLDSCQLKTYITASLPRVSCSKHGVHTVSVPWSDR